MGLPRSNLVKPKSIAVSAPVPVPVPPPIPFPEPSGIRSLEVATTFPQIDNPFLAQPVPAASGSVDVMLDEAHMDTQMDIPVTDPQAPSTSDLLERAARLGPARPTFESIVLPNDPILLEKMQPAAAQRRARFRKIVKATLGACLAVCVVAIGASALSPSEASASQSGGTSSARTAPARAVVSVEKLDEIKRGKAVTSHSVTANAAAAVKAKIGKRR